MKQGVRRFFRYARARHLITLRRAAGLPRAEWTRDPILSAYRFTCVFRELDRTTAWFREYVRDPMRSTPEVLLATVVFRLLNRVEVGEAIFLQAMLPTGRFRTGQRSLTAWDAFLASGDVSVLRHAIVTALPKGPYVTGAYIISSPPGYEKLDGVLEVIRRFHHESREWRGLGAGIMDTMNWRGEEGAAALMQSNRGDLTLEEAWNWFRQFDYLGVFHSYEIVTDLRHTSLLDQAPDIMTWANPGPGARRGMNRVMGRDKDVKTPRDQLITEMRWLLAQTVDEELWPQYRQTGGWTGGSAVCRDVGEGPYARTAWPAWEMRDVEHTLCEFDKFERVRLGEGRPRGVYR